MRWTHINKLMWVFEANYDRLMELIPRLDAVHGVARSGTERRLELHLRVLDRSRYTTTISLTHYLRVDGGLIPDPHMHIRLYHDAKVAEVIACQHHSRFNYDYSYPNPNMHQRHEKRRVNEFLAEWLTYCIAKGYRFEILPSLSDA